MNKTASIYTTMSVGNGREKRSRPENVMDSSDYSDAGMMNTIKANLQSLQDMMSSGMITTDSTPGDSEEVALRSILRSMDSRLNGLCEELGEMQNSMQRALEHQGSCAAVVKLNVRGAVFEISKESLLQHTKSLFYIMLSSTNWKPRDDGAYFIDLPPDGFQAIVEYLDTESLSYSGLTSYEVRCVNSNLDYFNIPIPQRLWSYSAYIDIDGSFGGIAVQLKDGRICSANEDGSIHMQRYPSAFRESASTLEGHVNEVIALLVLDERRVCSSSWDGTVNVWDVGTNTCELTLRCDNVVLSLHLLKDGGRLCTGDYLGFIKVFNLRTGELEGNLQGHSWDGEEADEQDLEYCVQALIGLHDGRLCSASADTTIRIWSLPKEDCDMTLFGHKRAVNALVQLQNGRLCSGSDDRTLMIWSLGSCECLLTLEGHTTRIHSVIQLPDGRICSCAEDLALLWNPHSGNCVNILAGGEAGTMVDMFQRQDGRLCAVVDDHTLRIWY